jgi:hypothetical protein
MKLLSELAKTLNVPVHTAQRIAQKMPTGTEQRSRIWYVSEDKFLIALNDHNNKAHTQRPTSATSNIGATNEQVDLLQQQLSEQQQQVQAANEQQQQAQQKASELQQQLKQQQQQNAKTQQQVEQLQQQLKQQQQQHESDKNKGITANNDTHKKEVARLEAEIKKGKEQQLQQQQQSDTALNTAITTIATMKKQQQQHEQQQQQQQRLVNEQQQQISALQQQQQVHKSDYEQLQQQYEKSPANSLLARASVKDLYMLSFTFIAAVLSFSEFSTVIFPNSFLQYLAFVMPIGTFIYSINGKSRNWFITLCVLDSAMSAAAVGLFPHDFNLFAGFTIAHIIKIIATVQIPMLLMLFGLEHSQNME